MDQKVTAAATVIIARDSAAGLEVLMIERAAGMGFAGGAMAFPGGKVDPLDIAAVEVLPGFSGLEPADAAARIAAARESFEETGILLSTGPTVEPAERRRLRPLSDGHGIGFAALLAGIGHRLEAGDLRPFARWLPPEGIHRRYDTRFYVSAFPECEHFSADGHEAVAARFVRPATLLAEADAGAVSVLFPTRCNLARVGLFATVADLLADKTPPPFVTPHMVDGWLTLAEGLGYPPIRENLDRVRRQ